MTIALVDGDIVAYRCSASAENDGEEISYIRADRLLKDIITATDASEIRVFLSGSANFRKTLYPEYKANRKDMKKPRWLQKTREYLLLEWSGEMTDGIEADDQLGIEASRKAKTIICSIDKDLKQVPGMHYNFVNGETSEVSFVEGWRNFYRQLVLGDKGDNVPGYDGKMRVKFPKFLMDIRNTLDTASDPREMCRSVRDLYTSVKTSEEELIRNARLLYLWRQENDQWSLKTVLESLSEAKLVTEAKSESTQTTPGARIQSTVPTGTKRKRSGSRSRGRKMASSSAKKRRAD